jgi:hypothetical protein
VLHLDGLHQCRLFQPSTISGTLLRRQRNHNRTSLIQIQFGEALLPIPRRRRRRHRTPGNPPITLRRRKMRFSETSGVDSNDIHTCYFVKVIAYGILLTWQNFCHIDHEDNPSSSFKLYHGLSISIITHFPNLTRFNYTNPINRGST